MNAHTQASLLVKTNPDVCALFAVGPVGIALRAGTVFNGRTFSDDTPVNVGSVPLSVGADYIVIAAPDGLRIVETGLLAASGADDVIGGFHYAPGGNADGIAGGSMEPAINPCSIWDRNFRPACPDPRGMALVTGSMVAPFWCDIYLTAADHLAGTSRYGVTIADGDDCPERVDGERYDAFDYETARAVMAHHGKQLLSVVEFFTAAYGVTERSAAKKDPKVTGLDAKRTSRFGLHQATGSMWTWGHDGHPDMPRASIFGGSWLSDDDAGSRYANVAHYWPEDSDDLFGARGRCDHLQLA